MKPLTLKIVGLNSFREEQEIDFNKLCAGGVFGIFGPTGSGKSTILDAVTLALYGKVERAERGTQGIINQNEEKVYVQFTFMVGGRKFTAERTYKKSNDGGVNQYNCRLLEEGDGGEQQVLAEKKKEMDEQIKEIIGLTGEDFTKAVVLPQGKFQEFLKLKGADRRNMLQRLFALEQYGEKLTKKIRQRLEQAKQEISLVVSRQNELGDASKKAVNQARQNLDQEKNLLRQIKEKDEQNKKKYEQWKQILEWQDELEKVLTEEKRLKEQEPLVIKKEEKLELALKANQLKPFIDMVNNEKNNWENTKNNLNELAEQLKVREEEFKKAEELYQKCQARAQTNGEQLKIKLAKLEEAESIEEKRDELEKKRQKLLTDYQSLFTENKKLTENIKKLEETRCQLQEQKKNLDHEIKVKDELAQEQEQAELQREAWQALQEVRNRLQEIEQELKAKNGQLLQVAEEKIKLEKLVNTLMNSLKKKEEELKKLPEPPLSQELINERSNQVNEFTNIISFLQQKQEELVLKEQELQENKTKETELQQRLNYLVKQHEVLEQEKNNQQLELDNLEQKYQEIERANLAGILKKQLVENQPCPVCGSLEHPQPYSANEENQDLSLLKIELEKKKVDLKKLEEQLNKIFTEQSTISLQLDNLVNNELNIARSIKLIKEKIEELLSQVGIKKQQISIKELRDQAETEREYLKNAQKALQDYLNNKEELTQEINQLQKEFNQENLKLNSEITKRTALETDLARIEEKISQLKKEEETKINQLEKVASGKSGQEILNRVTEIKKAIKVLQDLRKKEKEMISQQENIVDQLFIKKNEKEKIQQQLEVLINEGQTCKNQLDEFNEQLKKVTGGIRVKQVKLQVEQELAKITEELEKSSDNLEKKRIAKEKINIVLYSAQKDLEQIKLRLGRASENLAGKLREYQFTTQNQAEAAFCTEEEIELLKKEIDQFKQTRLIVRENITHYQTKLAGRSVSGSQWEELQNIVAEIEKQLEAKAQLVYKLEDRLETLEKNNKRWLELETEKKKWQSLIDRLNQLEKLFRGNTFVEFIAEEQLMQVALDASCRLGELTQYRYALEVDSEGGFIIRDDANGGMRRPVATLSGGETFLTSLALALALSSQIQLRGKYPLEFFFLDEGFGTLDSYLLETVMNSLERLRLDKMTIGIISHVPELKARIARKLVVEPAEKGGRGTRVNVETA